MRIAVLGPLESSGAPLSPRERAALSVLALRSPEAVAPDELADALWGEAPPATWPKQVQVCVSRMRAKLPPRTVETSSAGYRLVASGPDDLDVRAFEETVAEARDRLAGGEPDRAVPAYARALALWRGRAYEDITDWAGAAGERERLAELRQQAQEEWLEARLAAGDHRSVAVEAEALLADDPLRERRWELLALAQYRSGRQGDALATLRRARHTLASELGVDPGRGLVGLEQDVLRHAQRLDPPPPVPEVSAHCPYQGLTPFEPGNSDTYFGRREEVMHCLARLQSVGHLVLTGASGSGKTSLLRAGIMAALERSAATAHYLVPGSDPLGSLYAVLAAAPAGSPLVVDQLEELFLLGQAPETVARFCSQLVDEAGRRPLALAVRADQLGQLGLNAELSVLVESGLHLVRPLDETQLREVVEGPAAAAGLRLEPGLVDLLLRDVAEGQGALPLLSHTLVEIWRHRDGAVLTVEGYRRAGGLSGAVARTAEELYEKLSEEEQVSCRSVLLQLVELPTDGPPICRRVPRQVLGGDARREEVVASLVRARLLTVQQESVEVAHEALVRAWPRLRNWLDEDAEHVRTLRHLSLRAQEWDAQGRPKAELYRGARLQRALEHAAADPQAVTPAEQAFLDASAAQHRAELDAALRAAQRERRSNRRLRLLLSSTAGLLVLALVAGVLALGNRNRAVAERSSAQLEALVSRSLALRATDRDTAALLAVEAYRRFPDDPRSRSALLATFTADPGFLGYRTVPDTERLDGTVLPDGTTAFVVQDGQRAATMDLDSGRLQELWDVGRTGQVADAKVRTSADGRIVAVLSGGVLTVHRLDGRELLLGPLLVSQAGDLALSRDGGLVATSERLGAVTVRRLADGTELARVPAAGSSDVDGAGAVAFTPSGRLLVGSGAGTVRVVDLPGAEVVHEISGPSEAADLHIVAVTEDVAVAAGGRRLMAFDPSSGEIRWRVDLRSSGLEPCRNLVVADRIGRLYCGDLFGVVQERDLVTGGLTGTTFDVQRNDVGDLAMADGQRELVSFGAFDPVVARWRLDGSGPVTRLVAEGYVPMDGFEPRGERFVAARRPPDAVHFYAMNEFAVYDPVADRPVTLIPPPMEGLGWIDATTVGGMYPPGEELRHFDARTGRLTLAEPLPPDNANLWPAPAQGVYYSTFSDGKVLTFVAATDEPTEPSFSVAGAVSWLAVSPDGSRLAVVATRGSTGYLTLHDAATGELLAGPVEGVDRVAMSDSAVVGARGGAVTVYDPLALEAVHDLPGARGQVNMLAFDADGETLLATSNDQTVSIYDTASWVRLGDPFPADAPIIHPAYLHPSGDSLLVTVTRGVAWWRLDGQSLRDAACQVAGRDLTSTEWTAYLQELGDYRATCSG